MIFPVQTVTRAGRRLPTFVACAIVLFCLPVVSLASVATNAVEKLSNSDCLDCHTDPSNTQKVDGKIVPLAIFPINSFARSVHSMLNCTDCHTGVKELVHGPKLPPPDCTGCHEKEGKDYAESIHGVSHALGASGAANCWDCHGSHDILPVKDPSSPVYKLNLPQTCSKCHSNPRLTQEYQMKHPEAAAQYLDSIHGRALVRMGLIVAPSCNDCHGTHAIKRAVDRDSPINHANVAKTCGKCHVGIEETYNRSVHGQLLAKGDPRAAKIYETIGVYLGYAIPHYADFYDFRHLLILGRVMTGQGGDIVLAKAREVLKTEFPEVAGKIQLHVPDEKTRRVGQAVAAASLPVIQR